MKEFLGAVSVPEVELARLDAMAALLHWQAESFASSTAVTPPSKFPTITLPPGARSIDAWIADDCEDPDFLDVAAYLLSRGEVAASWPGYHWTPSKKDGMNRRVILPFLHDGSIVGYTARAIDATTDPRYLGAKPADFLFNNAVLRLRNRKYIVLVEGAFDAIAIDGVGLLGSTVTERQAAWLKSTGQTVILVPDQDTAGRKLIEIAVKHNWHVAFPKFGGTFTWWERDIKDVSEAVRRYGRLWVLTSIIKEAESEKSKIVVKSSFLNVCTS